MARIWKKLTTIVVLRRGPGSLEVMGKRCFTIHYVKVLPTRNIY